MSEQFTTFNGLEVMLIFDDLQKELALKSSFPVLLLAASQFKIAIQSQINISDKLKNQLFEEGFGCFIIQGKDLISGKIKLNMTLEFCPDESEDAETLQLEDSQLDSLDELRKEFNL